jgi:hypothetical protein
MPISPRSAESFLDDAHAAGLFRYEDAAIGRQGEAGGQVHPLGDDLGDEAVGQVDGALGGGARRFGQHKQWDKRQQSSQKQTEENGETERAITVLHTQPTSCSLMRGVVAGAWPGDDSILALRAGIARNGEGASNLLAETPPKP